MTISPPFWHPSLSKAFLMDWDGVIADTKLDFSAVKKKYYGDARAMLIEDAHVLSPDQRESLKKDLYDIEMDGAARAVPVPGALKLLEHLESGGIPYCIVSRNCLDSIKLAAETASIPLPEHVWARENSKWLKPDPRILEAAASVLGAEPSECSFVGDFIYDLQGARRAGMRAILIGGDRDEEVWSEWGEWCDVAYASVEELLESMTDPDPIVPWEYREITERRGEKWITKVSEMTFNLPEKTSPTLDAWLVRASALGVGTIAVPEDAVFGVDDWKDNASFDPAYMGRPLISVVEEFLRPRFPMVKIVEGEEGIKAPKNSLDLRRFLERKIY